MPKDGVLHTQDADSAEQLMSAFGTAAGLIQQSEYVRCQSEQAGPNTSLQEAGSGIAEVDAESLEAAKQVQAELHRAMHAALSTNNGYLIIPTVPGPPIQRRQAFAFCTDQRCSRMINVAMRHLCIHLSSAAQSSFLHACSEPALRTLDPAACCQHNIQQRQANNVMALQQLLQIVELTVLISCLQCPS
jgi:hypothetical protein